MKRPRGRPPLSPQQRAERAELKTRRSMDGYRNISVTPDITDMLNIAADQLEPVFGFRPTLSQTIKYLLRKTGLCQTSSPTNGPAPDASPLDNPPTSASIWASAKPEPS
jgi:hypothetical protein